MHQCNDIYRIYIKLNKINLLKKTNQKVTVNKKCDAIITFSKK